MNAVAFQSQRREVKQTGQKMESNPKEKGLNVEHSAVSKRSMTSSEARSSHHDILAPIRTKVMEIGEFGWTGTLTMET